MPGFLKILNALAILIVFAANPLSAPNWASADSNCLARQSELTDSDVQNGGMRWRKTRFGWEDARDWHPVCDIRPEAVPGVHPLAWSAILTLSVLVMLVWASESDEVSNMLPRWMTKDGQRKQVSQELETARPAASQS